METNNNLQDRIEKLEDRVKKLESQIIYPKAETQTASLTMDNKEMAIDQPKPILIEPEIKAPQKTGPSNFDRFVMWCKADWLMKLGAFLLLLALAWFVTYAFVNNWIGPMGRIALGIITGTAIMIFGNLIVPKKREPGQVLVILGGVMILLTIFAGRFAYDFFTPLSALGMMFVVVIGMAIIAVYHNAKSVGVMALLGGAVVPLLVEVGELNYFTLISYVFVLSLGAALVAAMKGWRTMIFLALFVVWIYSLTCFPGLEKEEGEAFVWIFMAFFFGLFSISNLVAIIKTKVAKAEDFITTGLNGILLLIWIYIYVPEESASLVLSGVVVLMTIIVYILTMVKGLKSTLYIYSGLAMVFLGAATAFELDGETLAIAFSIEVAIAVVLAIFLLRDGLLAKIISVAQVVPVVMALSSLSKDWIDKPLFNKDFFVLLIMILSLIITAISLNAGKDSKEKDSFVVSHLVMAGFFATALIWLSSHNIFGSVNVAKGVALVIYSLFGVVAFFYGTYLQNKSYRATGSVFLAGVVLRLLLVEVWSMSLAGKIVTFVAIGALLVSTAFFQKRIIKK